MKNDKFYKRVMELLEQEVILKFDRREVDASKFFEKVEELSGLEQIEQIEPTV